MVRSKKPKFSSNSVNTVLAEGSYLSGTIRCAGFLRIDGEVEGSITCNGAVMVGETGSVQADIEAAEVTIAGEVHGNINAARKLEVLSTGRLFGDVVAPPAGTAMEEGFVFEGRCVMRSQEPAVDQQPEPETL